MRVKQQPFLKNPVNSVNVKINGYAFKATSDKSILQTCLENNIIVPSFCYHGKLGFAGNCRMCLVEVTGSAKPVISCIFPVIEGMEIETNSPAVKKARESVLEFLLLNHPLDCPICDQAGECDLQEFSYIYGSHVSRDATVFREGLDDPIFINNASASNTKLILLSHITQKGLKNKSYIGFNEQVIGPYMSRCILCTKCLRFERNISGNSILGVFGRGSSSEIRLLDKGTFLTELSGNTVDLCPVGALTSRNYAFKGRPWDLYNVAHFDIFDNFGTEIEIGLKNNIILRVAAKQNNTKNEEWVSDKIRYGHDAFLIDRLVHAKNFYKVKNFFIIYYKNKFLISLFKKFGKRIFNKLLLEPFHMRSVRDYYEFFIKEGEKKIFYTNNNSSFLKKSFSFANLMRSYTNFSTMFFANKYLFVHVYKMFLQFKPIKSCINNYVFSNNKLTMSKVKKSLNKILKLRKSYKSLSNFQNLQTFHFNQPTNKIIFRSGSPITLSNICTFKVLTNSFGNLTLNRFFSNDFIDVLPDFLFNQFKPRKKIIQQNILINLDLRVTHPVLNSRFYVLNRNGLGDLSIFGNYSFFNYKDFVHAGLLQKSFFSKIICNIYDNSTKKINSLFWTKHYSNIFFQGNSMFIDYCSKINKIKDPFLIFDKFNFFLLPRYQNTLNLLFFNFKTTSKILLLKYLMMHKGYNYLKNFQVFFNLFMPYDDITSDRNMKPFLPNQYSFFVGSNKVEQHLDDISSKSTVSGSMRSSCTLSKKQSNSTQNLKSFLAYNKNYEGKKSYNNPTCHFEIPLANPFETFFNSLIFNQELIEKPAILPKLSYIGKHGKMQFKVSEQKKKRLLDNLFFRTGMLLYYAFFFQKSVRLFDFFDVYKKNKSFVFFNQLDYFKETDFSLMSFYGHQSLYLRKFRLQRFLSRNNFGKTY